MQKIEIKPFVPPHFDILWMDGSIKINKFSIFKNYQKVNHFPGM